MLGVVAITALVMSQLPLASAMSMQTTMVPVDGSTTSTTLAATTSDTDGDGLSASQERAVYGTAPTEADTDGDGYPDGMELRCTQTIADSDPLRQDIYVEVDTTLNRSLDNGTVQQIERTFATAPIANPDGTDGIDIHIVRDETDLPANGTVYSATQPGNYNDLDDYYENHFDNEKHGYYYVVVTPAVAHDGEAYYVGAGRPGVAVMEPLNSSWHTASLFMHEFGHSLGLHPETDGIDQRRYDRREYHSVMNYNGLYEQLDYSNGTDSVGRDEWAFVGTERYQPSVDCPETGCAEACPPTDA